MATSDENDNHRQQQQQQKQRNQAKNRKARYSARKETKSTNACRNNNTTDNLDGRNTVGNRGHRQQTHYPEHFSLEKCETLYRQNRLIRGALRVVSSTTAAFVACDRASLGNQDIFIPDALHRNRALHGDTVYVERVDMECEDQDDGAEMHESESEENEPDSKEVSKEATTPKPVELWQDDEVQMQLYNPLVPIERRPHKDLTALHQSRTKNKKKRQQQPRGRVVHVMMKKAIISETILPHETTGIANMKQASQQKQQRTIIGSLKILQQGKIVLLTPSQKTLVQFKCNSEEFKCLQSALTASDNEQDTATTPQAVDWNTILVQAIYTYGSWKRSHTQWPPCTQLRLLGNSFNVEHQVEALLQTHGVNHGSEFPPPVLRDVQDAVAAGLSHSTSGSEWEPTPDMCQGRRDYRKTRRVFTIDPTTAKDLDDALHIFEHPDGTVEIGVVRM